MRSPHLPAPPFPPDPTVASVVSLVAVVTRFLIETSGGAFGTSTWRKNPCAMAVAVVGGWWVVGGSWLVRWIMLVN